jgi:O-acetyl-ADP-ribose deacetylase (regulator of RNase III)
MIHTVGSIFGVDHDDEKLKDTTLNSLLLSYRNTLKSIAFTPISTGSLGFPLDRFAIIMFSTTIAYLDGPTNLEKVYTAYLKRILWNSSNKLFTY